MVDDDTGVVDNNNYNVIIIMKYLTKEHKREHVVLKILYSVQGNPPPVLI